MGMFDYVNFTFRCPFCGGEVKEFQSKSGPCMLERIEPEELRNFYSSCACGMHLDFQALEPTGELHMINGRLYRLDASKWDAEKKEYVHYLPPTITED